MNDSKKSSVRESSDQLVKSVDCYNSRPLLLHGYIAPFVSIYVILMYNWLNYYSTSNSQEIWFIFVAIIVVLQILCYLFSHWSVSCNCFLAFTKVFFNLIIFLFNYYLIK